MTKKLIGKPTTPPSSPGVEMFKSEKQAADRNRAHNDKRSKWTTVFVAVAMLSCWLLSQSSLCEPHLSKSHTVMGAICSRKRSLSNKLFKIAYPMANQKYDPSSRLLDLSSPVVYNKGSEDLFFVFGWILVMHLLQFMGTNILRYIGRRVCVAAQSEDKQKAPVAQRFAEQGYLLVFYLISISTGLYIWHHQKYYAFDLVECWTDYPVFQLPPLIKTYYLVQAAFWLQQLLLFTLFTSKSERRSDHFQMCAHHAITSMLVVSSYAFHFTRIGNVVLIVMDTADVFICLAKCLKYLGPRLQSICDVVFGLFAISWLITRHFFYFFVVRSIYVDAVIQLEGAVWDPFFFRKDGDWERPGQYFAIGTWIFFLALFAALQCLVIFWFMLIVKVVVKVLNGSGADDVREGEDD